MFKALVIEDEIALQDLYGRVLEMSGFEVSYANDGNHAIQMLNEFPAPELIVLDIRMPNSNGVEVLDYLQSYPGIENIHVIIASASSQFQTYADKLPSTEFLLKPVLPIHLDGIASRLQSSLAP